MPKLLTSRKFIIQICGKIGFLPKILLTQLIFRRRKKFEIEKTFFCTPAVRKAINLKEQKKWQVEFLGVRWNSPSWEFSSRAYFILSSGGSGEFQLWEEPMRTQLLNSQRWLLNCWGGSWRGWNDGQSEIVAHQTNTMKK